MTRIRFDVLDFEEEMADEDRKKAIVPFQLAYAVSIHKAQGLEYRSVKVVQAFSRCFTASAYSGTSPALNSTPPTM